ncbi:dynamin family protein [Bacillus sp. RG28]|uniref:Dynamin family protein n=1 Tax=Gottfriedia endophytica TaxID=2820819 RepID=A0A940SIT2_9BACI|nr:dynamin family protein [Gottfriedia endophytica]MBP0724159.1 dynamin family protein [Gottfriedia endophytica]
MQKVTTNDFQLQERIKLSIQLLKEQGNHKELFQLKKLLTKVTNTDKYFVFCGHFSAGKSSLLNVLLGVDELPTSPIPTSANVVKLKNGNQNLVLTNKNGELFSVEGILNQTELKEVMKNGHEIIEVEWTKPEFQLDPNVVIVDTPGIDSIDVEHLEATESVINLSDHIFYLMDYQHVHSRTNIDYIKKLIESNKEVSLIITCIDKHVEEELSFSDFKEGVIKNFHNQGVFIDQIFYISTKNVQFPNNDLDQLIDFVKQLPIEIQSSYFERNKENLIQIIKQQMNDIESEISTIDQEVESSNDITLIEQISEELKSIEDEFTNWRKEFTQSTNLVITNANLTPYEMRERVKNYLDSLKALRQKSFFQSRKKLESIVEESKLELSSLLSDSTKKLVEYYIKEQLVKNLEKMVLYDESLKDHIKLIELNFSLDELISENIEITNTDGQFLLQISKDIGESIQKLYKKAVLDFLNSVEPSITEKYQSSKDQLTSNLQNASKNQDQYWELMRSKKDLQEKLDGLEKIFDTDLQIELPTETEDIQVVRSSEIAKFTTKENSLVDQTIVIEEETTEPTKVEEKIENIDEKYKQYDHLLINLENVSLVKRRIEQLTKKRNQIKNSEYTLALFGAFSSGKSSFINTLLGERILAVSPHPTTAAICHIKKSSESKMNRTADIKFKSDKIFEEEFTELFNKWGFKLEKQDWFMNVRNILTNHKQSIPIDSVTYVENVVNFYEEMKSILGTEQTYKLDDYNDMISDEGKACFVLESTVYFDCELTLQGIVLVDTPGGNSIHSRHTEVAFSYLKNADLIIYVSHYQHAFTRQDESFLIQIGQMRESFDSDKVVFLLNASDLAEDLSELSTVKQYFEQQLVRLGVRFPRIFTISSLLQYKGYDLSNVVQEHLINQYTELTKFVQNYLVNDMAYQAFTSFRQDILQLKNYIKSILENHHGNQLKKEQYILEIKNAKMALTGYFEEQKSMKMPLNVTEEIQQLTYYIHKRIELRMRDLFTTFYNPSVLNSSTKNVKEVLQNILRDFLFFIFDELIQELHVTSYRIEKFVHKILNDINGKIITTIQSYFKDLSIEAYDLKDYLSPTIKKPHEFIQLERFHKLDKFYKNPKSFFENGMKEKMLEELISLFHQPLEEFLQKMNGDFQAFYRSEYLKKQDNIVEFYINETNYSLSELLEELNSVNNVNELEKIVSLFNEIN